MGDHEIKCILTKEMESTVEAADSALCVINMELHKYLSGSDMTNTLWGVRGGKAASGKGQNVKFWGTEMGADNVLFSSVYFHPGQVK